MARSIYDFNEIIVSTLYKFTKNDPFSFQDHFDNLQARQNKYGKPISSEIIKRYRKKVCVDSFSSYRIKPDALHKNIAILVNLWKENKNNLESLFTAIEAYQTSFGIHEDDRFPIPVLKYFIVFLKWHCEGNPKMIQRINDLVKEHSIFSYF